MKKLLYFVIPAIVYIVALFLFIGTLPDEVLRYSVSAVQMQEAILPVVSLQTAGCEINRLHGYYTDIDTMNMRESLTPIAEDRMLQVIINEGELSVRKLIYEVYDASDRQKRTEGSVISFDDGDVSALSSSDLSKSVLIAFDDSLNVNTEYKLRITLVTNESRRIYYYTSLVVADTSMLAAKIDFIKEFHAATLNYDTSFGIRKYLERKSGTDNTTFSYVSIYSSESMVCYGALHPRELFAEIATVTQHSKDTLGAALSSIIEVDTEYGLQTYRVTETFRITYTPDRVYVYSYDRTMEAVFSPVQVSIAENRIKLGITSDVSVQVYSDSTKSMFCFCYGNELWQYNTKNSTALRLFSYASPNTDYIRDIYANHSARIMNMDDDGNVDFCVYGYINRGAYEGRVGIVFYRFIASMSLTVEIAYFPVASDAQTLMSEVGDVVYRNATNHLFFTLGDRFFLYNPVSKVFTQLSDNAENILYLQKDQTVMWQNGKDYAHSATIYDLETSKATLVSPQGSNVSMRLFAAGEHTYVVGVSDGDGMYTDVIGGKTFLADAVLLYNIDGEIIKRYETKDCFVTDATYQANKITLKRVRKATDINILLAYSEDYILNNALPEADSFVVAKQITDQMKTEYYIELPDKSPLRVIPTVRTVMDNVISEDVTVHIEDSLLHLQDYAVSAFGRIIDRTPHAGVAIARADSANGSVIGTNGELIWQRGAKPVRSEIDGVDIVASSDNKGSAAACVAMLLSQLGVNIPDSDIDIGSVADIINTHSTATLLNIANVTLDEVLYFVGRKAPVVGITGNGSAVLIIAYDSSNITYIDPVRNRQVRTGLTDAAKLFENGSSLFLTYVE